MKLLSPFTLGRLTLPNRIVMAPMTRSRAIGGVPNELMRDYYTQRASAGLIVTEGVAPSPNGLGYSRIPGLFSSEQVEGWKPIMRGVHEAGGRIVAQLMHTGRMGHPLNLPPGARILAPSSVAAKGMMWTDQEGPQPMPPPEAMTEAEIHAAIEEHVVAAKNAIAAGFDGIELHGANGYLIEQFLSPHTNLRDDDYGGSIEKRARFVIDVAKACADAIGQDRVGIRFSPVGNTNIPMSPDARAEYTHVARALRGLLYVHLVGHGQDGFAEIAAAIREAFGGPVIHNSGFEVASAEAAIASGVTDLVAFGRPFIANPDLVERVRKGAPLAAPDPSTFFSPGPTGYVDYARL